MTFGCLTERSAGIIFRSSILTAFDKFLKLLTASFVLQYFLSVQPMFYMIIWENLYQANKAAMPKPEDPNLIHPGMKMKIPSLTGEYRKGTYDPKKEYEAYGK